MNKFIAGAIALVLGVGGAAGLGVSAASAHNFTDNVTCQAATVALANYDGGATVKVTLDGVVVHDTAPFGGAFQYNQALTFDANHQSHTMIVEVLSNDPGYSFTHTKTSPANCYTEPKTIPILPAVFHPATCDAASTFDVPAQDPDVKYTVDSPSVGNGQALAAGVSVTITAHVKASTLVENGGPNAPNSYTVTFTGQAKIYNASCVPPQTCTVGGLYHESDDNAAVLSPEGLRIFSAGDGKATDGGGYFLTSGNAQGITTFDYTKTGEVGNGIFFRLIFDLSADGGPSYASFSGLGTHVDQTTLAGYGSKAAFAGKTLADVANTWPKNKLVAFIWQTGSSYAAGDGAVLTGFSGYCGEGNLIPTVPSDTHRTTDTTDDIVCNADGIGGGSYNEVITHYTTTPVWNSDSKSYELVETVDEGYPQTIVHTTDASLESCPIHATPVVPTVTAVCDAVDTVTLATTANITYAITASDKNGATVTATPADATVLDKADSWTINEDGSASLYVVYNNDACPLLPTIENGHLAFTGSDPTNLLAGGAMFLLLGVTSLLIVATEKRRKATLK